MTQTARLPTTDRRTRSRRLAITRRALDFWACQQACGTWDAFVRLIGGADELPDRDTEAILRAARRWVRHKRGFNIADAPAVLRLAGKEGEP